MTIGSNGRIGRAALSKRVGLGEGAVRTVLKKLRANGYVEADASGCYLTRTGVQVYSSLKKKISNPLPLSGTEFTVGGRQSVLAVRHGGHLAKGGLEQRDAAVKAGALGATTYIMNQDKFTMPGGSENCEKDYPSPLWKDLRARLFPREGDAIILCGADDEITAALGALSAGLTLV
jgi:hypothetical protein